MPDKPASLSKTMSTLSTDPLYQLYKIIQIQTDPFAMLGHIHECHGNLLKWATSLKINSQI